MMKIECSKSFLGFLWCVLILSFSFQTVQADEELWHKVKKDNIVYNIIIDTNVELNGRELHDTDFITNINSIKVVEHTTSEPVTNPILIRDILTAAQSTALFNGYYNIFIHSDSLTAISEDLVQRTRMSLDTWQPYSYWAPTGWADLLLLTAGLDNSTKRKGYYNEVWTELIAQRLRYEYSLENGLLAQRLSLLSALGEYSDGITTLSKAGRVLYRAAGTLEEAERWSMISQSDVKAVVNEVLPIYATGNAPDTFPYLVFKKVGRAFETANFALDIGGGLASTVVTQARFQVNPAKERSEAVARYLSDSTTYDPEVENAFWDVMAIWNPEFFEISSDPNELLVNWLLAIHDTLEASAQNPEVLGGGLKFCKLVQHFSGPAAGWMFAAEGLMDFWAELDYANKAIVAATIERELTNIIQNQYEQEIDLNPDVIIDYDDFVFRSALVSMKSHAAYLYYYYVAQSLRINYGDVFDYVKFLAGGKEKLDYHEGRATDIMGIMNSIDLSANRYVYTNEGYYPLFYDGPRPDLTIQTQVNQSLLLMQQAGINNSTIQLTQIIENAGQIETDAHVSVVINGSNSEYHQVLNSATIHLAPSQQTEITLGWDVTGLENDSYKIYSYVYSNTYPEGELSNNKAEIIYQLNITRPIISDELIGVTLEEGQTTQINLDDFVNSFDIDPASLTWSWYGNSKVIIQELSAHVIEIQVPDDYTGTEKITFIVSDSEGHSDSKSIWIVCNGYAGLSNGYVTPSTGFLDDTFTYTVTYRNPNNKSSDCRDAYVNGIRYTMRKKDDAQIKDGAEFILNKLGKSITIDGNSVYFFEFESDDQIFRYPQQSILEGPEISIIHDVAITGLQINPDEPRQGQSCDISFNVENIGSIIEWDLVARLFVDGNEVNSVSVGNLGVADSSKVLTFTWTPTIQDETHQYEFTVEVDPVPGETNLANNSDTIQRTVKPERGYVTGWVLDQFNNPIEGAFVKVISSLAEEYGSTKTDHDGWYILDGLMPGVYTLEAHKDGEGTATKANVPVHSLQDTENQVFNLSPTLMTQVASGKSLTYTACSPDGQKLTFTQSVDFGSDIYQTLYRVNADGTNLTRLTGPDKPALKVFSSSPKFSPDGTKILFGAIASNNSGSGIWITSASGNGSDAYKEVPAVTNSYYGRYPTWSPDGQKIAYLKTFTDGTPNPDKLTIHNIADHTEIYLKEDRYYCDLAWSPDGNWIAYGGMTYLINATTGEERPILAYAADFICPCWLPDSTGFVYNYSYDVWLCYLETEEKIQITFGQENNLYPSVPRNIADKLAFLSNKGFISVGDYGLFTMPFSPPTLYFTEIYIGPEPFTPNEDGLDDLLSFSYRVNRPGYVTLKIHDSQGGYVKTLVDNELQDANTHQVTWDGTNQHGLMQNDEVYFYRLDMHDDANEVAIPAHGRVCLVKNYENMGLGVLYPRWSHYGDRIVYLKDESIWVCDSNDLLNKQIVPTPFAVTERPAWSRNDQQIVFPSKRPEEQPQIAKINLDGTGYVELTSWTFHYFYAGMTPDWSPTEDVIVFHGYWWDSTTEHSYPRISTVNSDGSGLQQLDDYILNFAGYNKNPVWSPDGSKIAWCSDISGNKDIWIMNVDDSNKEQFTSHPYHDTYPEFTPDGKRLLFYSDRQFGLWTEPIDGSDDPRCIFRYGNGGGVPSPDGSKILCGNYLIELFTSLTKGTIEGKIYDANNLKPIEDVSVSLRQDSNEILQTITNTEGAYQFLNVAPGLYTVDVNALGYVTKTEVAETFPWCFTRGIDFVLTKLPIVQVSSVETDEVLQGTVQLFGEGTSSNVAQIVYQYAVVDTYSEMSAMQTTAQTSQSYNWITIGTSDSYHPIQWDVSTMPSGEYLIRSIAYDEFGNADDSPQVISVIVDGTAPTADFSNIDDNDVVAGMVELKTISAYTDLSCVRFEYKLHDDILWTTIDLCSSPPYNIFWNTSNLLYNETYDLRAVAIDIYGNEDESPTVISVTVIEPIPSEACDFNSDGIVNFLDFAHLAENWLRPDCNEGNGWCEQCDLNKLGSVEIYDLLIFTENWLWKAVEKIPDLNHDDKVDFKDYAILAHYWMDPCFDPDCCGGSDLNENGVVDFVDLSTFARYWFWQVSEGDLDNNGTINFEDLKLLVTKWLWSGEPGSIPEDIIQDGYVDFSDFAALAENWMK